MSDRLYTLSLERLLRWILNEEKEGKIFGIYKSLFFIPKESDPFRMKSYGQLLETPIGVAAGPHTQLSQNIILSWLCGARYIELKTIQTLDEIHVTKPCIDMEDEGYNCEWSQELKIQESFDEYLNAWIIIHLLKHKFGWDTKENGFIFNMSVGYDYKGIMNPNVQWFFDKMNNCKPELEEKIQSLSSLYPQIRDIKIPERISDNVTLSTMHGCPPDEISKIGAYLIEERKLHTTIKLNPTLLGPEKLRHILNDHLGYDIIVPDEAFEHDLKYEDAIKMIQHLDELANKTGVKFSLKLTNTLESLNKTNWLPNSEKMIYTSGRALHPISINLAQKLQKDFGGKLDISFSAGIDAFNVSDTLACNLKPITICSDLLKPGGYLRLTQYLDEIRKSFNENNANSIDKFIINKNNKNKNVFAAALNNLTLYASQVVDNKAYKKSSFPYVNIKTKRELTQYNCIHAPCIEACAVDQNVPDYMYYTSIGEFEKAYEVILKDNPLPNITGNVCDHLCQAKCTRINYDNPLLIRGIKRFISEKFDGSYKPNYEKRKNSKIAVMGAGPSGLSAAYFLALEGFQVNVYESKSFAGGMASDSIPIFRLSAQSINADIELIKSLGVNFYFNYKVTKTFFNQLRDECDFIYIAVGAQKNKKLNIDGENLPNVIDQLGFLSKVRRNEKLNLGETIAVIGGGNSAIDAARTANRLCGNGNVTVIYRRTKKEMPADQEEIHALLDEGINILELTAPESIQQLDDKSLLLKCIKMELKSPDKSGRPKPVQIQGSEFDLKFDSIITAIGQEIDLDFFDEFIVNPKTNETQLPNVYAGGDAVRGADSLINAIADGKKVAETIIVKTDYGKISSNKNNNLRLTEAEYLSKQSFREFGPSMPEMKFSDRKNFNLVHPVLDDASAITDAKRCLFCDDVCNICVGVCPNLSNMSFSAEESKIPIHRIIKSKNKIKSDVSDYLNITQSVQIINIADFCNECGNCNTFCPTNGAPYKTKPRFHLSENSFASEDCGYFISGNKIEYKTNDQIEKLSLLEDAWLYESNDLEIKFSSTDFSILNIKSKSNSDCEIVLENAAQMFFLFNNLKDISIFR
ncbi:MAG: putative selenate reductase subunit YgfK [Ignavibacteriaceae bacterium]|nr:putative selenate reductase subunit YgfK [Ignavibacteriaceae bacterium]